MKCHLESFDSATMFWVGNGIFKWMPENGVKLFNGLFSSISSLHNEMENCRRKKAESGKGEKEKKDRKALEFVISSCWDC